MPETTAIQEDIVVPFFTDGDPFDDIEWERRDAEIKNSKGEYVFFQKDVEVPKFWSDTALNIAASKYFHGPLDDSDNVPSPKFDNYTNKNITKIIADKVYGLFRDLGYKNALEKAEKFKESIGDKFNLNLDELKEKYSKKKKRENSIRDLIARVADTISMWGLQDGYFKDEDEYVTFKNELKFLLVNQYAAFNSPVWFNVGTDNPELPQGSACFIQSIEDDIEDISELMRKEMHLFKYGSGTGTNYSTLRSKHEYLSGGGRSSGPCSFMKCLDTNAGAIKSGGRCLAAETPVLTLDKGSIKVKNLVGERFIVISYDKKDKRYKAKWATASKAGFKKMVIVHTDKGKFKLSEDHQIILRDDYNNFIQAGKLKPGMSLMPCSIYKDPGGYYRVNLRDGNKGKILMHRLVAKDILGININGKIIHHKDENILNNNPLNLVDMSQSKHAYHHGKQKSMKNRHHFQHHKYPKKGENNPMHKNSPFWRDKEKVKKIKEKHIKNIKIDNKASKMQYLSSNQQMLNLAYKLINEGYDISTFQKYIYARKKNTKCGRIQSVKKIQETIEKRFGSYENFLNELVVNNHRVISVEILGIEQAYDVHVECNSPDDKGPLDSHNFVCGSVGQKDLVGGGICILNTRRSARLAALNVDHPDIDEFIELKSKEERKAHVLIKAGYDSHMDGEAYTTVAHQNTNYSVRVTDKFMQAVIDDVDWDLLAVTTKKPIRTLKAKKIWEMICKCAWESGDPGIQFDDVTNEFHTVKNSGRINGSNPCCFTGDTLIDTSEGFINFEELYKKQEKRPHIFSWDLNTSLPILKEIKKVWIAGETNKLVRIKTHRGITIKCTPEHKFLTHNGEYIEAQNLKPGEKLKGKEYIGSQKLKPNQKQQKINYDKIESILTYNLKNPVKVYDMEIEGTHNFYVSSKDKTQSIVVHNSEFIFLDDTSCNLSSLNLMKFYDQKTNRFNIRAFRQAIHIMILAQEIIVDRAGYPSYEIAKNSRDFRPLGLGYSNLGNLLMVQGIPYDSDEGRSYAAHLTAILGGEAYVASALIASRKGPFNGFYKNKESMLNVIRKHTSYFPVLFRGTNPGISNKSIWVSKDSLSPVAFESWRRALEFGKKYGYRNSQTTLIAPTGTISFMMDCETTGIEPSIALVAIKHLSGGGQLSLINKSVKLALERLRYTEKNVEKIIEYIEKNGYISGAPGLNNYHIKIFETAIGKDVIKPLGHVKMMAAVQPFLSGSISKTTNVPNYYTPKDIGDIYMEAWKLGLKSIAVYRDGSKEGQPLTTKDTKRIEENNKLNRKKLPNDRTSITHKFEVGGHEGYLTMGMYDDGKLGEIFIRMSKEGSTVGGLMDVFATCISFMLQYGIPLEVITKKLIGVSFEPSGITNNPDIRFVKSPVDYIAKLLKSRFIDVNGIVSKKDAKVPECSELKPGKSTEGNPACSNCGSLMVRAGSCYSCQTCGETSGCS